MQRWGAAGDGASSQDKVMKMPRDPYIHERMTQVVAAGKKLKEELLKLQADIPMWDKRVVMAQERGMPELARQAAEHVAGMRQRAQQVEVELEILREERRQLQFEHAVQPGRDIVARTEAMVDSVRIGGLVDPDKAKLENELHDLPTFDFGDGKK
jgi:signal transduction protein with GAF and PtsI domain